MFSLVLLLLVFLPGLIWDKWWFNMFCKREVLGMFSHHGCWQVILDKSPPHVKSHKGSPKWIWSTYGDFFPSMANPKGNHPFFEGNPGWWDMINLEKDNCPRRDVILPERQFFPCLGPGWGRNSLGTPRRWLVNFNLRVAVFSKIALWTKSDQASQNLMKAEGSRYVLRIREFFFFIIFWGWDWNHQSYSIRCLDS